MSIGALDIIIAADTAQLRKGMDTAVGIMQSSTQKMESFAKTAGASIAGYFALNNLRDSVQQSLDLADSLGKMSQKVGVSVDTLYSLQAAGKLADVDIQSLEKSLLKFNKGLGAAELGTGDTENALKQLGISLKDSAGHLKMSDEYLYEVADKFKSMPDGIAKSKIAMDLFGKSGADMIPLLNGGAEALREYSGIMDQETARGAEKFNDSLTTVGLAVDAVWMQMANSLAPTLSAIADDFTDVAKEGKNTGHTLGNNLADGMKVAIGLGYQVAASFSVAGGILGNFGAAASLLAEGDFAGAKFAWNKISEDIKKDELYWDKRIKRVMEAKRTVEDLDSNGGRGRFNQEDYEGQETKKEAVAKKAAAEKLKRDKAAVAEAKKIQDQKNADDKFLFDEEVRYYKEQKDLKKSYQESYADLEAKTAIETYENRINAEKKIYDEMLNLSEDWYTSESIKIADQYAEYEKAEVDKVKLQEWLNASVSKLDKDQIEKLKEGTIEYKTVFEDAFKSMEDSMVNMFMTGKFSAEDFFNTVIEGIIRMQIRNSITQPLTQAIGGVNFGEMFSGMFGNSSTTVNAVATSGAYNAWDGGMIPQYAIGGYTGDGGKYEPKGIVHGGEYVIPKWMVQKSPDLIGSLESTRKRGYADGGLVGSSLSGTSAPSMPVTINIENKSGTPISAESVTPQFDGKSMVINVVIDAITRNSGGMRDVVRSVR